MDTAYDEKRKFPRMPAECPILYKLAQHDKWILAKLFDLSATGFSMICTQKIEANTHMAFQVKKCSNTLVPELSGQCEVRRSIINQNGDYIVSCKILKIDRNQPA